MTGVTLAEDDRDIVLLVSRVIRCASPFVDLPRPATA